jgi:hypothetical protein
MPEDMIPKGEKVNRKNSGPSLFDAPAEPTLADLMRIKESLGSDAITTEEIEKVGKLAEKVGGLANLLKCVESL